MTAACDWRFTIINFPILGYYIFIAKVKNEQPLAKEEFGRKLGERLRYLREKKGISLRDFETYDESMDRHALSRIENGYTVPSAFTLYRIAHVIGIRIEELFKDID